MRTQQVALLGIIFTVALSLALEVGCTAGSDSVPEAKRSKANSGHGIFTARLKHLAVVPGTAKRVSPEGFRFNQPMMHPDGTHVTFWGNPLDKKGSDVWTVKVDGSDLRQLTMCGDVQPAPFWLPDGSGIVYSSKRASEIKGKGGSCHLWLIDADGKNLRQITQGTVWDERPCVAPDGRTIVFSTNRSGRGNHWVTDIDGAEPRRISKHEVRDYRGAFSPDGRHLAYFTTNTPENQHNLAILEWPDGEPRMPVKLKENEWIHGPFWTADAGKVLVHGFLMGRNSLYLVDVRSGQVSHFNIPGFSKYGHASWDRAETVIVFGGIMEP